MDTLSCPATLQRAAGDQDAHTRARNGGTDPSLSIALHGVSLEVARFCFAVSNNAVNAGFFFLSD